LLGEARDVVGIEGIHDLPRALGAKDAALIDEQRLELLGELRGVAVALVVVIGVAFLFATLIKTVVAAATYDAQCINAIANEIWVQYAECLQNGGSCINPVSACK